MSFEQGRETIDTASSPAAAPRTISTSSREDHGFVAASKTSTEPPTSSLDPDNRERLDHVLQSDIGVQTLLTRLKQSVSSARDFASFLKERASLEERHAQGLKRLCRGTRDMVHRPESRSGSFAHNYEEITAIQERMADHGLLFTNSLHQMHDELQDLSSNCERGRKHWKQTGLASEKRYQDAEMAMDKAKAKYNSLAEQYDRARTGEKQTGKFGLKGPKSAAQQEEDLHRKLEGADTDYDSKVKAAQTQKQELLTMHRPQAVHALKELIRECDAALSMQIQKYAAINEKLVLQNGLVLSPLKGQAGASTGRGLRDVAQGIDNDRDFHDYVLGFTNKAGVRTNDIKYEKHPALSPKQQQQSQSMPTSQQFDVAQPQFGTPERTNTGAYEPSPVQGHRPTQSGQISGVTSTPYNRTSGADRLPMSGPQAPSPYTPSSQPPRDAYGQTSSQLPQLPPMESLSMSSDADRTPNIMYRGPEARSSPATYQGQGKSSQAAIANPDSPYGSPTAAPANQQVTLPTIGSMNYYTPSSDPRADSLTGPRSGAPISGSGSQSDLGPVLGPQQESYSSRGPSLGPVVGPHQESYGSRGPSLGQPGDFKSDISGNRGPSVGGSTEDNRSQGFGSRGTPTSGPSDIRSQLGNDNRAPSLGHPSDFRQVDSRDHRGPSYGQPGAYQSEPRGPSSGPSGSSYLPSQQHQQQPSYPSSQSGNLGSAAATGVAGAGLGAGAGALAAANNNNNNNNSTTPTRPPRAQSQPRNLPPLKPVFGVPLDELFRRDGTAVPAIVYQCVKAVDMFGLDTEGIYRTSGSAPYIMELKALFDHDSYAVDFRSQASFHHDIASVTTLFKHFLRDLPDPLLTSVHYNAFIQAAKIEDDIGRRDTLHAIINDLPDPNYATLRVLTLHLFRVAQHSDTNRMTFSNLAICFGPTLMGHGGSPGGSNGTGTSSNGMGSDVRDAGWQARVVETILHNTYQIFDDDE